MFAPTALAISALIAMSPSQGHQAESRFWLGDWQYIEAWKGANDKSTNFVVYTIEIENEGNKLMAHIDADGYMTFERIAAEVVIEKNSAKFFVHSHFLNFSDKYFEKGELLFEMVRVKGKVITIWHKISPPALRKSQVYFTRPL
jgi:hypothetical protein